MSTEARESLGSRVRDERKRRRWGQRELAHAAEVSIGTVSNFERGLSFPQPHHLRAILRALDMEDPGEELDDEPQVDISSERWFADQPDDIRTALYMIGLYLSRFDPGERDVRIREIVGAIIDRRL